MKRLDRIAILGVGPLLLLVAAFAYAVNALPDGADSPPVPTATTPGDNTAAAKNAVGGDQAGAPADSSAAAGESDSDSGSAAAGSESGMVMLITSLTVFVLAIFVGFEVITKVPPTLHTPLMSGSNAISGITIVGALILAGAVNDPTLSKAMAFVAVIFATINVVGGYLVTDRMLRMFKRN
jgi:NAD(P) transhydrogenase subunit alpha